MQSATIDEFRLQEDTLNKAKIEDVSSRQARWKVAQVTTLSKQALWFAHSFGLEPQFIQFRKGSILISTHSLAWRPISEWYTTTSQQRWSR